MSYNFITLGMMKMKTGKNHPGYKHGMRMKNVRQRDPLYNAWQNIKQRCLNPRSTKYPNYGGLGIRMYEPWSRDFQLFRQAVSGQPYPLYTLGLIDPAKGYVPGNVTWMTQGKSRDIMKKFLRNIRANRTA